MKHPTRQTYRLLAVLLSFVAIVGAILSNRLIRVRAQEGASSPLAAQKDEIAFASKRGGSKYGLYTLHPDGTSVCNTLGQSLCTTGGSNFNIFDKVTPAWSPDGTKLAFASNKDTFSNLELYIYDDNTQAITRLTTSPNDSAFPTWSPDGTRIAFMNGQLRVNGSFNPALIASSSVASQIFIVNSSGGTPTLIAPANTNRITPAWSPNASQNTLVYARQSTTSGKYFLEKAVVNSDNTIGTPTALTNLPPNSASDGNNIFPAWSPDGARIAFTSDRINPGDALGDIWIMNADASGLTQFTTSSPQFDIMPVWSPDGTQIAWTRGALGSTDTSTFDIWRQGVDASSHATGTAFNITNNAGEDSQATWRNVGGSSTPTPTPTPTPTSTPTPAPFTLTFEGRLRDNRRDSNELRRFANSS
jgi:Tol biopolymer transport system component